MVQAWSKDLLSFKMQLMVCSVCASQQLCPCVALSHWFGMEWLGKLWVNNGFMLLCSVCFLPAFILFLLFFTVFFAFLTTEHWADISGNYPELFWDLFHELLM